MEGRQTYTSELRMKEVIYRKDSESPELVKWPWKVYTGPKWCGLLAPWRKFLE